MILSYKHRIYPNKKQAEGLDFMLWQMRTVYNDALNERKWMWERSRIGISYYDQWARFKQEKKRYSDTLGLLNTSAMQQTLRRLDKAYRAAFRRIKRGEKAGFPRFKSRARFRSLELRHGDGSKLRDKGQRKMLYVQNIGESKLKWHRELPQDAKIKQVVVKEKNGKLFASKICHSPL